MNWSTSPTAVPCTMSISDPGIDPRLRLSRQYCKRWRMRVRTSSSIPHHIQYSRRRARVAPTPDDQPPACMRIPTTASSSAYLSTGMLFCPHKWHVAKIYFDHVLARLTQKRWLSVFSQLLLSPPIIKPKHSCLILEYNSCCSYCTSRSGDLVVVPWLGNNDEKGRRATVARKVSSEPRVARP